MAREFNLGSSTPGMDSYLHWDEHDGKMHIEHVQDAEPVMDHVANYDPHANAGQDMHYVGEIPMTVVFEWMKQGFNMFEATEQELQRWLQRNKRDYGRFLVHPSAPHAGIIVK